MTHGAPVPACPNAQSLISTHPAEAALPGQAGAARRIRIKVLLRPFRGLAAPGSSFLGTAAARMDQAHKTMATAIGPFRLGRGVVGNRIGCRAQD